MNDEQVLRQQALEFSFKYPSHPNNMTLDNVLADAQTYADYMAGAAYDEDKVVTYSSILEKSLIRINNRLADIVASIDDLKAAATDLVSKVDSTVTALDDLAAKVTAGGNISPADITAITDQLSGAGTKLSDAVAKDDPAPVAPANPLI